MKNWKKLARKILFPPLWLMIILTFFSTVALIAVFVKGCEMTPIAYIVYMFSFYSLTVLCIACAFTFTRYYKIVRRKIYDNKYGNRYMTDPVFKTQVSLYCSLTFNLLYVAVNFFLGIWYGTVWFSILGFYYTILAVMRFLLLRYANRNEIGKNRLQELRRSRLCAIILLTVNLTLSGAVLMILYQDRGVEYHGVLIYVMAMYTFYITTAAVVNIIKYRKYNSPIMSTTKVINLAAALISMLSLETAMLSQFGADNSPEFHRMMIAATGGGVSVIIVAMAIYIIVRSTRELRNKHIRI